MRIFYFITLFNIGVISLSNCQGVTFSSFMEFKMLTDNKDSIVIKVLHDNKKNLLLLLEDNQGYLYGAVGLGNSNIVHSDTIVKAYKLNNDKVRSYVIETYVNGSTYGANNLVVMWNYKGNWNIARIGNNSRIFVEDKNNDGNYEFVEYYLSKNKDGDVFEFNYGCLTRSE